MPVFPNILTLLETGCDAEARAVLARGLRLRAADGPRSGTAAIAVATRLYAGDLLNTVYFMNRPHPWLGGQTPIARAEESEEGLEDIITMIGQIEAGVYI